MQVARDPHGEREGKGRGLNFVLAATMADRT